MYVIGLLHHHQHPDKVEKAYFYAIAAKAQGAELMYFSPQFINLENKTIKGYYLVNGRWNLSTSHYPDVIMNAGSISKLAKYKEVIDELKKQVPFTSVPVGNKMQVYERLLKNNLFKDSIIPTETVNLISELEDYLKKYSRLILKPIDGHRGQHIIYIEKHPTDILIQVDGKQFVLNNNTYKEVIQSQMDERRYIMQPYIESKTKEGHSYHIRIHMVKNHMGEWAKPILYACISPTDNVISNSQEGGNYVAVKQLIYMEFPTQRNEIINQLNLFGLQLAKHLDELQTAEQKQKYDELGIDIGIDENQKIWIFEVNWRPGFNYPMSSETNISENLVGYAIYLAKQHNKRGREQ